MISQKRSYNPRLKSRKGIKNYELDSMTGSGIDKKCLLHGPCLQKGFTLSDVLKHNQEVLKTYSREQLSNYEDSSLVSRLLEDLPAYVHDECKSRAHDDYACIFNELIFIKDLEKLNVTITDDEKKKYIKGTNLLDFFRKGVLTYGETKKRYKELHAEIKDDISKEEKKGKETTVPFLKKNSELRINDLKQDLAQLENHKIFIDDLKKLCKYPVKNLLSISQKRTNPKCKFEDSGDNLNSRFPKPNNIRYNDINTNEKGV